MGYAMAWTAVPVTEHQGPHNVFVPPEFNKTIDDFPSVQEFLHALREFHKEPRPPQLRLV